MININPDKIVPSDKRLLIKIQEKATETSHGIVIAGSEQNTAPTVGEVLKAGKNSIYREGDIVIFRRYAVDEIRYQDNEVEKTVWFIEDSDALGKIESAKKEDKCYSAIEERKSRKLLEQENTTMPMGPVAKKKGRKSNKVKK